MAFKRSRVRFPSAPPKIFIGLTLQKRVVTEKREGALSVRESLHDPDAYRRQSFAYQKHTPLGIEGEIRR